jgi:hypothetical protein
VDFLSSVVIEGAWENPGRKTRSSGRRETLERKVEE